jgi:hypothetical protein
MGLIDILNGMQNGPRGSSQPSSSGKGSGMSPIMMALLGLLAYKAVKSIGGQPAARGGAGSPSPSGGSVTANQQGGGIGDILGGLLGGKPGSVSTTNVGANPNASLKDLLPGGLGELLGGAAAGTAFKRRSWRSHQGISARRTRTGAIMGRHWPQPEDRVQ